MISTTLSAERPVVLRLARLIYASDQTPGIRRRRRRRTFTYLTLAGRPITGARTVARIRSLAIPPAWEKVWICPDPRGHIQATGRDARGRKQYIYHPNWRNVRDDAKYGRLVDFARCLGKIRRRLRCDLRRRGLRKEKVLAAVVQLMEATLMRVATRNTLAKINPSASRRCAESTFPFKDRTFASASAARAASSTFSICAIGVWPAS